MFEFCRPLLKRPRPALVFVYARTRTVSMFQNVRCRRDSQNSAVRFAVVGHFQLVRHDSGIHLATIPLRTAIFQFNVVGRQYSQTDIK